MSLSVILTLLAWGGQTGFWIGVVNRLHATRIPCRGIRALEKLILLFQLAGFAFVYWRLVGAGNQGGAVDGFAIPYLAVCWFFALVVMPWWIWRRRRQQRRPAVLLSNHTQTYDVPQELGCRPLKGAAVHFWAAVPGNEILKLHVQEKSLWVRRLPPALDGLSIVHFSDLHLTGRIIQPYYDFLIDRANELDGDLTVITGDLVDEAVCINEITDALARLQSRDGVFFVLGNHDRRLRPQQISRLRKQLSEIGLIDLGGRWAWQNVRGRRILMAGNEAPWFAAPQLPTDLFPVELPSARSPNPTRQSQAEDPFRVLLSHSPDQIVWSRKHGFDLMLAGHTHGGQVRIPGIGPIVAPSKYGVRYAGGVFDEPPTLLHVSRGIAGLHPLRWNCPPELTKLVLCPAATESSTTRV